MALDAVRTLRSTLVPQAFNGSGDKVYVTGETAGNLDYIDIVNAFFPWVIALVLALSFVLLMLAFRSIVVPATSIVMNLLSVGAAYGLITLVSQHGVGAGVFGFQHVPTIEQWVPLFLFSVLFGLSMDYQVFLLSRIKEEYDRSGDNRAAVAAGIGRTAGIITGAALIMVAVFAGFASGKLVMFQQMGFGLGVAVLLDAFLVRTLLVPSIMSVLGRWNWYLPRWLEWLPRLSIEGTPSPLPGAVPGGAPDGTPAPWWRGSVPGAGRREGRLTRAYSTILFSGYSTIPSAPASLRRGISSRTADSFRIVSTACQPSSASGATVGLCSAGRTASTFCRSPFWTLSLRPTMSRALIAPSSSMRTSSILRFFQASRSASQLAISWVVLSSTVSTMRSLLARSDVPVSVTSTMASASSGSFASVAPQLNSTRALTPFSSR